MAHPNIRFSTCAHRRGREKGALTPIRRPRTPQTLPHMLPSGTEFGTGHAVWMRPRTSATAAVGRHCGPPRIGSENSPRGHADGSPRNSGAPWRRATPPTSAPARQAFAGVSEPRLPPPAARAEATGAPHATVPGEHRGSREVSGEQHGRQRCRSNRWAVRVALTCPCTSSASSKRMPLERPAGAMGARCSHAAHNGRKHNASGYQVSASKGRWASTCVGGGFLRAHMVTGASEKVFS